MSDPSVSDPSVSDLSLTMAAAANQAPSVHNSQPWHFVVRAQRLDILADLERATPVIDPVGRGMHMACGAAVLNAFVTGRAAGRAVALTLGPWRDRGELLATLDLGGTITASETDVALARAVAKRHTVRSAFEATPVPPELIAELRAAVELEGAWLAVVGRQEDIIELAVLTAEAEAREDADENYRAELKTWLTTPDQQRDDGIPVEVLASEGQRASDVQLRDFLGTGPAPVSPDDGPPEVERPLLVVIGTDGDARTDWLRAGMAMQRLWLTATAAGLGASPMTQALDHAATRALLTRIVGLEQGHPQMLLRLGYAQPTPTTRRRAIDEVIAPD